MSIHARSHARGSLCALSLLLAAGANFQAIAEEGEPVVVGAIVVEGLVTATEGATAITGEDLRREQPTTVDELFRNTPGVEGLQGPGRQFGDVNIRGVDGAGAVVVSVDGAEKNSVEVKHGIAFNPIFFNADFLKRVTVVKGAVSNVYGAGSIGGKIVLETIDPVDLIDPERGYGAQTRHPSVRRSLLRRRRLAGAYPRSAGLDAGRRVRRHFPPAPARRWW